VTWAIEMPPHEFNHSGRQPCVLGAVFAGVAVALVVQLILNQLGFGLGAATFDPAGGNNPSASTFSIGAGIWWTASGVFAALAGGYTAGRLAGQAKAPSGAWHGFRAWAVITASSCSIFSAAHWALLLEALFGP
jgi:hypothetical protein